MLLVTTSTLQLRVVCHWSLLVAPWICWYSHAILLLLLRRVLLHLHLLLLLLLLHLPRSYSCDCQNPGCSKSHFTIRSFMGRWQQGDIG